MHKLAVIDLGTNTFNLVIAHSDGDYFQISHSEKIGVALGMGGINKGLISDDAFERGLKALSYFKSVCDEHEVECIKAFGTSALRDASNRQVFIDDVLAQTGIQVEIISGDREAELIYKGVNWTFEFIEKSVIMDIGGGSTEFIFADKSGILEKKSFDIGVSRIFQEMRFSDPLTESEIEEVKNWLEAKTEGYFSNKKCRILVGASGSFETFYEMIHEHAFEETVKALVFPFDELTQTLQWIIGSTQTERDLHPYIIPIRRRMAPIAAIKTQWILEQLGISETFVTPCSLKEGVMYEHFIEKNLRN